MLDSHLYCISPLKNPTYAVSSGERLLSSSIQTLWFFLAIRIKLEWIQKNQSSGHVFTKAWCISTGLLLIRMFYSKWMFFQKPFTIKQLAQIHKHIFWESMPYEIQHFDLSHPVLWYLFSVSLWSTIHPSNKHILSR